MTQSNIPDSSDPFTNRNKIPPSGTGELDGLSFAVKDNIDIADEITGYGSPAWANTHSLAAVNAICVEQLLNAGGHCEGKTKSDELAYSLLGVNSFYGTPLNPKAPDRVPGGSSSGSASAVASATVDFAIGTDTGGSIRMPASNCGVWGYRPSSGAISVAGVLALAPSFDTVGIISQTGEVLEKVMRVLLADNDAENTPSFEICFIDDVYKLCDQQLLEELKPFVDKLSKHNNARSISLEEITESPVSCNSLFEQLGFLLSSEIWNTFGAWIKKENPRLSSEVEYNMNHYARSVDRKDISDKLAIKRQFQNKVNRYTGSDKVFCFPTTVDLAPRIDQITAEFLTTGNYIPRAMGVNAIASLSGAPQITIPVAEVNGVPVGLSFLAACGRDTQLIRFCNQVYSECLQR